MNTKSQLATIFLIFALCLSLINVNPVLADDAPPTEPPAATEEATEQPVATEEPTSIPELITETPPPVESDVPTEVPTTDEEVSVEELLSEIPANTELVVMDENGDLLPLASQAAADIILEADPIWCPVGVAPIPNVGGCTADFATPALLLSFLQANQGSALYQQAGVIYLESANVVNVPVFVDASLFPTLKNFALTIKGGWNNVNSAPNGTTSTFDNNNNAYLHVGSNANPWVGNVTLQDIFIQDNTVNNTPSVQVFTTNGSVTLNNVDLDDIDDSTAINVFVSGTGNVSLTGVDISDGTDGSGITIITNSGNISLADVDVTNQDDGYTANLQSQSGNITITNGTSNGSSFNGGDNSLGFVATTTTGTITVTGASGSGNQVTFNDADGTSNGATLSASTVTLTQVTANNNNMNGIQISNANTITLNNVIATNNGTDVSGAPDLGSCVRVFGTGSTVVNINGGTYSNNERYTIDIINGTFNIISAPSMTGNDEGNSIIVDSTPPSMSPSMNCSLPGNAGWCRGTITINWNASDAQSAVTTSGCQTSFNSNTSSAGTTLSCSATSTGGTTTGSITVYRDGSSPNTTGTRSPSANGSGWNNTNVTVTFTGTDTHSGIASCSSPVTITTEGSNQPAAGSCTDVAGNTDNETVNVNIDKTAPTVNATLLPNPNGNGWNNSGVLVIFQGSDPGGSGVPALTGCSPLLGGSSSQGANQASSSTCTDRAGNSATLTVSLNIDLTNPVATATKSPAPNANGWNNTNVVVTFAGTDNLSGIDFCTPAATVSAEGANQSRSGTCTDMAGRVSNTAIANNINIDKTPPTISLVSRTPANGNGWNNGDVTVQWSCSDPLSGAVSSTVSQTVTTEGTNQSVTGTCQDRAGNTITDTQIGINIDKTAPTFSLTDVFAEATGPSGANVNYSALANDNLDTSPTVNCLPASGGVYPLGSTPVTCTATDDAGNSSAPSSFNIVVQDTTPPTIAAVANFVVDSHNGSGRHVTYSSPAISDIVDGAGIATCTPASGNFLPVGINLITCSATDSHGNTATISFTITVNDAPLSTTTSSGFFIPATGGSSVKLDCVDPDSFNINMAGARIVFNNLCEYDAFINDLEQLELPGELPSGFGFIDGYGVNLNKDGKSANPLPQGASVAIEFNVPADKKGADFGVLYWDGSKWAEIAGEMTDSGHFLANITAEIANSNTFIFVTK